MLNPTKVKFARKILKIEPNLRSEWNYSEWQLERDLLRLFARERHENIVQVISVYQWNDQINFIFPFYPHNLHDVLHSTALLEFSDDDDKSFKHWLWIQMIGVADGLKTIHSPRNLSLDPLGLTLFVGFHFDLKPANILVTPNGVLKITDFGQSWIKARSADDESDGHYRGGSLVYRPPEACPTRKEVTDVEMTSQRQAEGSAHRSSGLTKFRNVYDVWSLGCIMIEVIIFIFRGGPSAVKQFLIDRDNEHTGIAFHNGQGGFGARLKQSVQNAIKQCSSDEQCETLSPASLSYLQELSDLLRHMLDVSQDLRCTSEEVVDKLVKLQAEFDDSETPEDEITKRIKHRSLAGYDEVVPNSSDSFMHM